MTVSSLPIPTGKHKVGRLSIQLKDQNRLEYYSTEKQERKSRELVVWIWYPASPVSDSEPAIYLPDKWSEADFVYGVKLRTTGFHCHSFENAPVDVAKSTYPVIVFSQAGFSVLSYSAIIEEIVSHGYIVVGINHTYDAPVSVFSDGRIISASPEFMEGVNSRAGSIKESFQFRAAVADYKTADIQFVVDQLEKINKGSSVLAGRLDRTLLGAFGHSLGGNAALEFCRKDDRCRVAVNLDGANWNKVGKIGLRKPAMIIASEHPEFSLPCDEMVRAKVFPSTEWCEEERRLVSQGWQVILDQATPGYILTIIGTKHANFADIQFAESPLDSPFRVIMGIAKPELIWRITCDYLIAMFDTYLKCNNPSPLLDGSEKPYPEVVVGRSF
jgi:platelet-activating factor acetylhydrolase isoform II